METEMMGVIYDKGYCAAQLDAVKRLLASCKYDSSKIEAIAAILNVKIKEDEDDISR